MFMDIYSRKIVGYQVYLRESSEYAADLLEAICLQAQVSKNKARRNSFI